jgi:hypothetical protein
MSTLTSNKEISITFKLLPFLHEIGIVDLVINYEKPIELPDIEIDWALESKLFRH